VNRLLADHTNGRAYDTVLIVSYLFICRMYIRILWLNGASYRRTVWRRK